MDADSRQQRDRPRRGGDGQHRGRSNDGRGEGRGRPGPGADPGQDAVKLARSLEKVLERIPATQAAVLRWRMGLVDGQPHSTADTAKQLGLTLGETRSIEERAFEHIREAIPVEHLQRFLRG